MFCKILTESEIMKGKLILQQCTRWTESGKNTEKKTRGFFKRQKCSYIGIMYQIVNTEKNQIAMLTLSHHKNLCLKFYFK